VRLVAAVVLAGCLTSCGKTTVEYASVPDDTTTTTAAADGRLHCSVTIAGAPIEPVPEGATPRWSRGEALEAIRTAKYFQQLRDHNFSLYLATYSGTIPNPLTFENHMTSSTTLTDQLVWAVVVDGLELQPSGGGYMPGVERTTRGPVQGFAAAVFVDGVSPPHSVSGLEESGGDPPTNC
jgi:hypothetical protein